MQEVPVVTLAVRAYPPPISLRIRISMISYSRCPALPCCFGLSCLYAWACSPQVPLMIYSLWWWNWCRGVLPSPGGEARFDSCLSLRDSAQPLVLAWQPGADRNEPIKTWRRQIKKSYQCRDQAWRGLTVELSSLTAENGSLLLCGTREENKCICVCKQRTRRIILCEKGR